MRNAKKRGIVLSYEAILKLLCYFSLAVTIMPVVDYYCPWYVSMIPLLFAVVPCLLKGGKTAERLCFIGFAVAVYVLIACFLTRTMTISNIVALLVNFSPCFIIVAVKERIQEKKFYIRLLRLASLLFAVTSLTTIIGLGTYPEAARELAAQALYADKIDQYYLANIGGYQFIYSLVLFSPLAIWGIRRAKGAAKLFGVMELALYVVCIYESKYTIALIMIVFALLLTFTARRKVLLTVLSIAFVLMLLLNGFSPIGKVFEYFSEIVEHNYVSDKLLQISQLLQGQTVATETSNDRLRLYQTAWQSFLNHPFFGENLFGYNPDAAGGHSFVLDLLAEGGLFVFAMVVSLARSLYLRVIGREKKETSIIVSWLLATVVAVLNPIVFASPIMVLFFFSSCVQWITAYEKKKDFQEGKLEENG